MALSLGKKLGSYEIVAPIGAGGMGEVYRAWDGKLAREVAIKVLPASFAADIDRILRFEREARVLAQLNHHNIASIYDVEEVEGVRGLVMELVRGLTLGQRLKQGPLALEEVLPLAHQIADALEYAHERGIIHRDLKPANIKLSADNNIKILDFGLAKAMEGDDRRSAPVSSSTISHLSTQAGMILGTAAYMSPEQAKGRPVDRRTDIWAFGCVLFEMLTGKMVFEGETTTDVLAAVVTREPDWSLLPETTPARIRDLLQRCLRRDPKLRLQSIGDARITIAEVSAGEPETGQTETTARKKAWPIALPWVLAVCCLAAAVFLWLHSRGVDDSPRPSIRASIIPPPGFGLSTYALSEISPDGRSMVFVVSGEKGQTELWVRSLSSQTNKLLTGTAGAFNPFWSYDSQWIAFFANNKLKKISVNGGGPLDVCDSSNGRGGSWGANGTILFVPDIGAPVHAVSSSGGTAAPVIQLDKSLQEAGQRWPLLLPDGRHYLFFSQGPENAIYGAELGSSGRKLILKSDSNVLYDRSGYLLFVDNHVLMAQSFDPQRLVLSGLASPIVDDLPVHGALHLAPFSASANGILTFQTQMWRMREAVWLDRLGHTRSILGEPGLFETFQVSPDGKSVAFSVDDPGEGNPSLWVYDTATHRRRRLTFGATAAHSPIWSPDGKNIVFDLNDPGQPNIYTIPASGEKHQEPLLTSDYYDLPTSWSPDGQYLAFMRKSWSARKAWQVWILPLNGKKKPYLFLNSPLDQRYATFSPDGKWLAFESNESGRYEVYLVPFPNPSSKLMVSTEGGTRPKWSGNGRELFYQAADGSLMTVSLQSAGTGLQVIKSSALFKHDPYPFDVSPDGKTFLTFRDLKDQPTVPVTLITNWTTDLKK